MAAMTSHGVARAGAELIEFAIVAPILLLLIAGIVDFGMMFRTYEAVTNAAREGAPRRRAARLRGRCRHACERLSRRVPG